MAEQRETWALYVPHDAETPSCIFQTLSLEHGSKDWRETTAALTRGLGGDYGLQCIKRAHK